MVLAIRAERGTSYRQSVPIRIREPLAPKEILHTNGTLGLRYGASVRKSLRFG
jgi:hypothetical protein